MLLILRLVLYLILNIRIYKDLYIYYIRQKNFFIMDKVRQNNLIADKYIYILCNSSNPLLDIILEAPTRLSLSIYTISV